jgi:uncharacterized membrane protein
MNNKMKALLLVAVAAVAVSNPALAAGTVDAGLTAAATTFKEDFLASSTAIGTVLLGAAFGAIIWQWLKAAIFS